MIGFKEYLNEQLATKEIDFFLKVNSFPKIKEIYLDGNWSDEVVKVKRNASVSGNHFLYGMSDATMKAAVKLICSAGTIRLLIRVVTIIDTPKGKITNAQYFISAGNGVWIHYTGKIT